MAHPLDAAIASNLKLHGVDQHCVCEKVVDYESGHVGIVYDVDCPTHFPKSHYITWGPEAFE